MRFASRQSALFGNPEIGVGLVPGGGALEWLPRLVGRSRALEIVLSGDDFDADIAERYGWVNRTLDDDDLDSFVDALVRRLASFDREALAAAKAQINRFGMPTASRASVEQRPVLPNPGLAQCAGAPRQDPRHRLRRSERFRIELRPVPPCARAGATTITRMRSPPDRRPELAAARGFGRAPLRANRHRRGDGNEASRENGPDHRRQQYRACNGASVRAKGVVRSGRLFLLEMTDQGGSLGQD